MNDTIKKKYYWAMKIFWISIGIIVSILIGFIHLEYNYSILKNVNLDSEVNFITCEIYVFDENKNLDKRIDIYTHSSKQKFLEKTCNKKYPHKRDYIIEHKNITKTYLLSEQRTKTEIINLPDNVILDKSHINIEIKIPAPNITRDVTFFWFSVWKIQNKSTIRIWAIDNNILTKSYTLDEAYYDGDIEFILTNLKWNDIEVNYSVDFYIQS